MCIVQAETELAVGSWELVALSAASSRWLVAKNLHQALSFVKIDFELAEEVASSEEVKVIVIASKGNNGSHR